MKHSAKQLPAFNSLVRVHWIDATSEEGWVYLKPAEKVSAEPRKMQTVGYLVGSSPTAITLTHTLAPREHPSTREGHLGYLTIPRGSVLKLETL